MNTQIWTRWPWCSYKPRLLARVFLANYKSVNNRLPDSFF